MAGLMDAEPASHHVCLVGHCTIESQRRKAVAYSILYSFIRESVFDARDIDEDTVENVSTMATYLGMANTTAVLIVTALASEVWLGKKVGLVLVGRAVMTASASSWVAATQPRERRWIWAAYSLLSLVPAWHAQAGL